MSKVYTLDTETTGTHDDQQNPGVIELAFAEILTGMQLGPIQAKRFSSKTAISFGAMAVHHIIPSELEGLPEFSPAALPEAMSVIVGHNVDFDWKMIGSPAGVKRVCSLAMARRRWENESGHSLGACLYRIRDHAQAREMLRYAHGAAVDVRIGFEVFEHLIKYFNDQRVLGGKLPFKAWQEIWECSEDCRIPRKWNFGKHRGKSIGKELASGGPDRGYHDWFMRQIDGDKYVQMAISKFREGSL